MDFKDWQKRLRLSIEGTKVLRVFLNINKAEEKEVHLLDVLSRGGRKRNLQIKSTVTSCYILTSYMKCPKISQCLVFKENAGNQGDTLICRKLAGGLGSPPRPQPQCHVMTVSHQGVNAESSPPLTTRVLSSSKRQELHVL